MATANNLYTFPETAGALIIIFNQNKIYFFSNEKKKERQNCKYSNFIYNFCTK